MKTIADYQAIANLFITTLYYIYCKNTRIAVPLYSFSK